MLQHFIIMLMLDAQNISLLCLEGVTLFIPHYAHTKKLMFNLDACFIEVWGAPPRNPASITLAK